MVHVGFNPGWFCIGKCMYRSFSNDTIVYAFDTVTTTWSTPNISGLIPISRQQFQAVEDSNGKIYMFGGFKIPNASFDAIFNDIQILDTLSLTWTQGSNNVSAPTPRVDFTATLLNNGLILYIGGVAAVGSIYMSEIATGDTLYSRSCHTAVLSPDGHIVIYGGGVMIADDSFFSNLSNVNSKIYLLDTRNYMWVTKTLQHSNSIIKPILSNYTIIIIVVVVAIVLDRELLL
ncbi:hypothetical protein C2G38_2046064 [Gigaspora rosea]|uniref:Galactose oxidase n=1 Tax=Gigaspora rosea TaxID=44941 RepID=A0A397UAT3_9GLOM|nr:hypothetical protein C2G38_2046064 [Gigaspora rosea]